MQFKLLDWNVMTNMTFVRSCKESADHRSCTLRAATYVSVLSVAVLSLGAFPIPSAFAQCPTLEWRRGVTEILGPVGDGANNFDVSIGVIYAVVTWDPDGPGGMNPWLVVGGDFEIKGDFHAKNIAAWDGERWRPMGAGLSPASVLSLAVFDSGNGPELYAGGNFSYTGSTIVRRVAKWNGEHWTPMGNNYSTLSNFAPAMTVFDDGGGPQLYISGFGRWNGSSYTGVPSNPGVFGYAMAAFDDGSGPALYFGGRFQVDLGNGVYANNIIKWDGTSWSALGSGIPGFSYYSSTGVYSLAAFRDASGPALYVGGEFTSAGGIACQNIAKWDGQTWSTLQGPQPSYRVSAMSVFNEGDSEKLYIGTGYANSYGFGGSLRVWDGTQWRASPPFAGNSLIYGIFGLTDYDDGSGPKLVVSGRFVPPFDTQRVAIATWDGYSWHHVGRGFDGYIHALTIHDDGNGPAVYAGGRIGQFNGTPLNDIARWHSGGWIPLGDGVASQHEYGLVEALVSHDDGSGPALFAAGDFDTAGGVSANGIARWNGLEWQSLAGAGGVGAMAVHDDGAGESLFAGGSFTSIGGVAANAIAKWNGSSWSPLGNGLTNDLPATLYVQEIVSHDDGFGPALYVHGYFDNAGGLDIPDFARWKFGAWEAVGSGPIGTVELLFVHDHGTGPKLYVIGRPDPNQPFLHMSFWNGTDWSTPIRFGSAYVYDVATFDDGCGPALYSCGYYSTPAGSLQYGIAKWTGTRWEYKIAPPVYVILDLLTVHEHGEDRLYASGTALFADGVLPQFGHLAILGPSVGAEDINQDLSIDLYDVATLADCLGGPIYPFPSDCMNSTDIDADFDVDLADFAAFQRAFGQ